MYSNRINALPPYLFADLDRMRNEAAAKGVDVIDLGVGDPDIPTPAHVIEALYDAARDPANHRYPSYVGLLSFREAVADWYRRTKGVDLDPETEVLILIGSKEGIAHTPFAFINQGDVVLVPDPGYPVYHNATILADGTPVAMPLQVENEFQPDLDSIDRNTADDAKLMFLNYPNNPTTAVVDNAFFQDVVSFAGEHNIIVCHDDAYSEISFDGYRAPSFLECEGAMDVGVEFHSLSKTYNMTGWRIGFAVGNADILAGIARVKTNVDSGTFQAVQHAGIAALTGPQESINEAISTYQERRDVLLPALKELGLNVYPPRATFYIWAGVPGSDSMEFCKLLLDKAGIVATPGVGFGTHGEGYVRFALTKKVSRIEEAAGRLSSFKP